MRDIEIERLCTAQLATLAQKAFGALSELPGRRRTDDGLDAADIGELCRCGSGSMCYGMRLRMCMGHCTLVLSPSSVLAAVDDRFAVMLCRQPGQLSDRSRRTAVAQPSHASCQGAHSGRAACLAGPDHRS